MIQKLIDEIEREEKEIEYHTQSNKNFIPIETLKELTTTQIKNRMNEISTFEFQLLTDKNITFCLNRLRNIK